MSDAASAVPSTTPYLYALLLVLSGELRAAKNTLVATQQQLAELYKAWLDSEAALVARQAELDTTLVKLETAQAAGSDRGNQPAEAQAALQARGAELDAKSAEVQQVKAELSRRDVQLAAAAAALEAEQATHTERQQLLAVAAAQRDTLAELQSTGAQLAKEQEAHRATGAALAALQSALEDERAARARAHEALTAELEAKTREWEAAWHSTATWEKCVAIIPKLERQVVTA
jgi:chromosome segregation ATPase